MIRFYSTRDVPGAGWGAPEVDSNIFRDANFGRLGLTADEIEAIVAFLETLTDGYVPTLPATSKAVRAPVGHADHATCCKAGHAGH